MAIDNASIERRARMRRLADEIRASMKNPQSSDSEKSRIRRGYKGMMHSNPSKSEENASSGTNPLKRAKRKALVRQILRKKMMESSSSAKQSAESLKKHLGDGSRLEVRGSKPVSGKKYSLIDIKPPEVKAEISFPDSGINIIGSKPLSGSWRDLDAKPTPVIRPEYEKLAETILPETSRQMSEKSEGGMPLSPDTGKALMNALMENRRIRDDVRKAALAEAVKSGLIKMPSRDMSFLGKAGLRKPDYDETELHAKYWEGENPRSRAIRGDGFRERDSAVPSDRQNVNPTLSPSHWQPSLLAHYLNLK